MSTLPASLNGWPVLEPGSVHLARGTVPGTGITLTVRDICLPLFLALAADYNRVIEPLTLGTHDDAGYAYRAPRTATTGGTWSNHASGTAVDLNWTGHGARTAANRAWWQLARPKSRVQNLQTKYPILTWGGNWSPTNFDPMHWEITRGIKGSQVIAFCLKAGIR